jgi:hypothetical protein
MSALMRIEFIPPLLSFEGGLDLGRFTSIHDVQC